MKKKRLKLKQSAKEKLQSISIICLIVLIEFFGTYCLKQSAKHYNETYLDQTKMTESIAVNQSK